MEPIELDDIQRLVIQGYPARRNAVYALLEIQDAVAVRRWLGRQLDSIGTAIKASRDEDAKASRDRDAKASGGEDAKVGRDKEAKASDAQPLEKRLSIAFTWKGLQKLGFPVEGNESGGFVGEFREGMVAEHRSLSLGDTGANSPSGWRWGQSEDPIHILLIVFSASATSLKEQWEETKDGLEGVSLWNPDRERAGFANPMYGDIAPDQKEHFGFRDGISQPYIAGSDTSLRPSGRYAAAATVAAGEFLLGYRNEMGKLPASPRVPKELDSDGNGSLPAHPEDPAGSRDFGRNGTYLVMRQLEQHVDLFKQLVASQPGGEAAQELFAAKLVGRQKDGSPLVASRGDNDFGFYAEDRYGFSCPVGSHIRRANPRDSLADPSMNISPDDAQALVNRHRMIRRGRLYGEYGPKAKGERGLLFVCLNANLQRQFEFVQQHWINGPKFGGLDEERDPLVGVQPDGGGSMTIQARPLSHRIDGIEQFVTVRGGAYFFLPGVRALKFLATPPSKSWPKPARPALELPRFRRSRWYPFADLQTLANQVRRTPDLLQLERTRRKHAFPMTDGSDDKLLGMLHEPKRHDDGRPLVLVIHGLPGSQDSKVVVHSAAYFLRRGYRVLRLNQRGAGPSQGQTSGIYHAGRSGDLYEVVGQLLEELPDIEIVMIAYSLGANVMLRMLGESDLGHRVRAAVSVSAPVDLEATASHLEGLKWLRRAIYVRSLLRLTKNCARDIQELREIDRDAIEGARDFRQFDQRFLAPFNGFEDASDYYGQSSAMTNLASIEVPTLLIHAEDDPMVPFAPCREVERIQNPALYTRFEPSGGHAGFHQRGSLEAWHDCCAEIFFKRFFKR
jgi:Dyp-type peroxidase family